jgi:hypothetical protein
MTDQYRATPEQWAAQRAWAVDDDDSSCILELRARVEALEELHNAVMDLNKRFSLDPLVDRVEELEARYETQRQVTLAWGKDVYNHGRWIDAHLKRIKALEAGQKPNYPEIPDSSPAPADSLVEMPEAFQTLCAYARNYIEEHGDKSEADELECIIDLLSRTFDIPSLPPEATP